jgi:hypothetical protein
MQPKPNSGVGGFIQRTHAGVSAYFIGARPFEKSVWPSDLAIRVVKINEILQGALKITIRRLRAKLQMFQFLLLSRSRLCHYSVGGAWWHFVTINRFSTLCG